MKKHNFYTLIEVFGKAEAVEMSGYTDENFNYYRNGSKWYAIDPATGASVARAYTRSEAAEIANSSGNLERMRKVLSSSSKYSEMKKRFKDAVHRAGLEEIA